MNITKIAQDLIYKESKSWLSGKLGISRVTLDSRLLKSDWKKSEIQTILILNRNK